jgi:OTU domain-containing protein 6
MDELLKKHRQEQRELQGRITQKKKNSTKKTRKGVNDECAELERQLKERQEHELKQLDPASSSGPGTGQDDTQEGPSSGSPDDMDKLTEEMAETAISNAPEQTAQTARVAQTKKPNRQKARLARRAAEQEALAVQAVQEASALPDRRGEEQETMARESKSRGLVEQEVRSDGHCLYAAIADQLRQIEVPLDAGDLADYMAVRRDAANFMEKHPDDFAPFLDEPFGEYLVKVRETGEWGGQLEITALSRAYAIKVNVLQGDGRVEVIEPGPTSTPENKDIWLAYYRHSFGLGEHYNSLRRRP